MVKYIQSLGPTIISIIVLGTIIYYQYRLYLRSTKNKK